MPAFIWKIVSASESHYIWICTKSCGKSRQSELSISRALLCKCVAVCCIVLQCVSACFRVFPCVAASDAMRSNASQHTATHCNTLQHTATHCNTLQHTATHAMRSNASPNPVTVLSSLLFSRSVLQCVAVCCRVLQRPMLCRVTPLQRQSQSYLSNI